MIAYLCLCRVKIVKEITVETKIIHSEMCEHIGIYGKMSNIISGNGWMSTRAGTLCVAMTANMLSMKTRKEHNVSTIRNLVSSGWTYMSTVVLSLLLVLLAQDISFCAFIVNNYINSVALVTGIPYINP